MTVRFHDPTNNGRQPIVGEIYLQGAILMTYDSDRDDDGNYHGSWQAGLPSWDMRTEPLEHVDALPRSDLVVQDITIEAMDHNELFYVAPFVPLKPTVFISYNYALQRLLRTDQDRVRQFQIQAGNDGHRRAACNNR